MITLCVRDNNGAESYSSKLVTVNFDSTVPNQVISLNPEHGALYVDIVTVLKWADGGGANSFDIYLGTTPTLSASDYLGNQNGTEFNTDILALDYDTTYYWRVDSINAQGTTLGNTCHCLSILSSNSDLITDSLSCLRQ